MPVRTACTSCGKKLQIRDELLGKKVKCPACGTAFLAEAAGTSEAVKADAPRTGPGIAGKDKVSAKPLAKKTPTHRDGEEDEDSEDRPARGKKSKAETSSKTMWIGIAAAVVVLVGGIGAYLLMSGTPAKTAAPAAAAAPKKDKKEGLPGGSVPLAELVSSDAWLFTSQSPVLHKAPVLEKIRTTPGLEALIQSAGFDTTKEFGIADDDLERLSSYTYASFADFKKNPYDLAHYLFVVQTNKPVDQKAVSKAVKSGKLGKTARMSAHFVSDQALIVGTTAALKLYMSKEKTPATGVLEQALAKASTSQGLVACIVFPPEAAAGAPPILGEFLKTKAILVTLDLTDRLVLSAALVTDDATAARGIKKAADDWIGQAKSFLDLSAKDPNLAGLVPVGRSLLKELKLSLKDKDVTFEFQTDAAKLVEFATGGFEKLNNPPPVVAEATTPKQPEPPAPETPKKDPVANQPGNQIPSQSFQGQNLQGGKFLGKKGQKGFNPNLQNPNGINPKGPTPIPLVPGEVSKFAAKLSQHLGAVIDLEARAVLLLLPNGQARLYAYPDFGVQGTFKLGAGPAYRPVHDKAKERLFALSPNLKGKDATDKGGGSQAVIYPIRDLLDGKLKKNSELAPSKTIPLGGFCTHLCLSPDGDRLYALETSNPKALKVLRINVAKGVVDGSVPMPDFTTNLILGPDGKALYALSHLTPHTNKVPSPDGAILVIDPETMKLTNTVNVPIDPFAMEVTKEGIAFVSSFGGVRTNIVVLNIGKKSPLLTTWRGVLPVSGSCLKLAEDEKFLYVSNWKGSPATVGALAIPDPEMLLGSEMPKVQWVQSPYVEARGEMVITPDRLYILCDSGVLFFLKTADQAGGGRGAWFGVP